jgi:hypothetical protein
MPLANTKLILIDGFTGIGKSTTAQRLWLHLTHAGRDAAWFHEHEIDHPIFQYGEVEELLSFTPQQFEAQILSGWARFAAQRHERTCIIESSFLQLPVGVLLAMNVPAPRIRAVLRRIDAACAALDVSLVHLYEPDLRAALTRISATRGPDWLQLITSAVAQSPYGQAHGVCNLRGLIGYYRRQRLLIDAVLPRLSVRHEAVDVSGARWDKYERRITGFLGIRRAWSAARPPADLLRHVGTYRGTATGLPCQVTTDLRALYVHLPAMRAQRLLPIDGGRFCVESMPIDIRFTYGRTGQARWFTYASRLVNEMMSDTSWVRA